MDVTMSDRLYIEGCPTQSGLMRHFRITNPQYLQVKRFSPTGGKYSPVPPFLYAGIEDGETLMLPRSVVLPEELLPEEMLDVEVADKRVKAPVKFPSTINITLNKMQTAMQQRFEKVCREEVPPGFLCRVDMSFGKTIGMLNLARVAGQKTLVLTHRKIIFDVWRKDIDKMFGRSIDVGLVNATSKSIGKHITIGMLQTIQNRNALWLEQFLKLFGTVILDEAHICPMPYVNGVIGQCPALYRIGGTATIERKEIVRKQLYWVFGEPAFKFSDAAQVSGNQISIDEARIVRTQFLYEPEDEGVFDAHEMTQKLIKNKKRNRQIVEEVVKDLNSGHRVLLATSRVAHTVWLARRLRKAGFSPIVLTGGRTQGAKQANEDIEQLKAGKRNLLIATEQLIREGANIEPLDRLHVAVPITSQKNFTQLCGRICRTAPGKVDAKVTIYFDLRTPALRKRISVGMLPVLRKLKVPNVAEMWIA